MAAATPWWAPHVHADRRPFLLGRARITAALRAFFAARDFIEVEAAILQVSPGNEAHLHAFATELVTPAAQRVRLYLHTSPEFAAKKLLAAGERRIFEFARVFRNRERGALHHPEFTLIEWYRVDHDHHKLMDDVEQLIGCLIPARCVDRSERLTYQEVVQLHAQVDALNDPISMLLGSLQQAGVEVPTGIHQDRDALLASTLSSGLQADYAALIEKRNLKSLHFTKEASASAQQLLAVCHDCYDALLATGFSKYIIGSMAAPVRWILRLGGLPSDKQGGMADLQMTADHGHYLAPFARILLAIAYVRDKNTAKARETLIALQKDFPNNHLFPLELARLEKPQSR